MKITEILTESEIHDLQHLEEGPLLNKVGAAVGDVAGGVAKGVGAVAGGVAGMGRAFKKGFASGKARVAGDADPNPTPADPQQAAAGGNAPAAQGGAAAPAAQGGAAAPAAGGNAPAAQGGAAAPAASGGGFDSSGRPVAAPAGGAQPNTTNVNVSGGNAQGGTAAPAAGAAPTDGATGTPPANPAAEKAGQTLYAQVKSQVGQLDKKGKQRILALLNKSLGQPGPADQKAAAKPAAPAGNFGFDGDTGKPFASQEERTAWFKANNKVDPKAPKDAAPPTADATQTAPAAPAADATQQAPAQEPAAKPKRTRNKKTAAAPAAQQSQAEIDAERERVMGPTSDSIIRTGNNLAETLLKAIAAEKRRMVAEGKISIFRAH